MKQMDSALMYVEQKILQEVVPEIYRQFDQREELLKQSFYTFLPTDHFAEGIFYQISG